MKTCPKCGEVSEDQFDSCWRCSTPLPPQMVNVTPGAASVMNAKERRRAAFQIFRGTYSDWESLCTGAAEFATKIGPQNLITISHSEDKNNGVVVVWYWTTDLPN